MVENLNIKNCQYKHTINIEFSSQISIENVTRYIFVCMRKTFHLIIISLQKIVNEIKIWFSILTSQICVLKTLITNPVPDFESKGYMAVLFFNGFDLDENWHPGMKDAAKYVAILNFENVTHNYL